MSFAKVTSPKSARYKPLIGRSFHPVTMSTKTNLNKRIWGG